MKKLLLCIGLVIACSDFSSAQSFTATRNEIKQGDNVVATYTRKETRKPDNTVEMVMTFKGTDGATIATATIPYQRKGNTIIRTEKDNKTLKLQLQGGTDLEMAQEIAKELSTNKYL